MKLEDKVAVITGAGSGIGYEMATLFAREGARIMGADVDADGLATTAAAVEAIGRPMRTFVADVTDPTAVENLMAETVEAFGSIDILCNNAGIGHVGSVLDVTPEEWDRVMAVNVRGVYLGCKYAVPYMLAQGGGIIVNTASVAGQVGLPKRAVYSASKGAVIALTKQVAIEYVDKNIRVNCVCPGTVETPWVQRLLAVEDDPAAALENLRLRQPMGRLGQPDEVAKAALYLASDAADFITGIELVLDGGLTAR